MSLQPQITTSKANLQLGERYANVDYSLSRLCDKLVVFYDNAFTLWPVKGLTPQQEDAALALNDHQAPALIGIDDDTLGMRLMRRELRANL
ncbi:hypothetical protein C8F04DRAFT_1257320 [Mycena alexandri]|uniref:Uncharacterized protein n=1 Tax=Mycena alexandri TaxID=1745969 RepID=A0AAD6T282_9AGAR|nr:hypothetical protein C8F04DRAFT_1257320 [Mycena alexandri]